MRVQKYEYVLSNLKGSVLLINWRTYAAVLNIQHSSVFGLHLIFIINVKSTWGSPLLRLILYYLLNGYLLLIVKRFVLGFVVVATIISTVLLTHHIFLPSFIDC